MIQHSSILEENGEEGDRLEKYVYKHHGCASPELNAALKQTLWLSQSQCFGCQVNTEDLFPDSDLTVNVGTDPQKYLGISGMGNTGVLVQPYSLQYSRQCEI